MPIEELIKLRQKEYYYNLGIANKKSDSSVFVEFMLEIIKQSIKELALQNWFDRAKKFIK